MNQTLVLEKELQMMRNIWQDAGGTMNMGTSTERHENDLGDLVLPVKDFVFDLNLDYTSCY